MEILSLLKAFLVVLPELIQLVDTLRAKQAEAATAEKVKADLKGISDAFKNKDVEALKRIFTS